MKMRTFCACSEIIVGLTGVIIICIKVTWIIIRERGTKRKKTERKGAKIEGMAVWYVNSRAALWL